jgi:hypothetical protein
MSDKKTVALLEIPLVQKTLQGFTNECLAFRREHQSLFVSGPDVLQTGVRALLDHFSKKIESDSWPDCPYAPPLIEFDQNWEGKIILDRFRQKISEMSDRAKKAQLDLEGFRNYEVRQLFCRVLEELFLETKHWWKYYQDGSIMNPETGPSIQERVRLNQIYPRKVPDPIQNRLARRGREKMAAAMKADKRPSRVPNPRPSRREKVTK